jgi:thioredoxin reductase (NADPH)
MTLHDLIVIGEGIGGLACAGHAAAAGLRVASFEAEMFGGLVINVAHLDGYTDTAFASGMDLAADLAQSNAQAGVASIPERVTAIRAAARHLEVVTDAGIHGARHVVIATGARLRKLGVPGEDEFEGRGVSRCADCDAPLFRGEDVVVVGGGDSAAQEALVLAQHCRSVNILHRGDRMHARADLVQRLGDEPRIRVTPDTVVEAIIGGRTVEALRIKSHAGASAVQRPCAGVCPFVGLQPNSELAPAAIARDGTGGLVVNAAFESPMAGVWAIGQVRAGFSGLLRDAVREAKQVADAVRSRVGAQAQPR